MILVLLFSCGDRGSKKEANNDSHTGKRPHSNFEEDLNVKKNKYEEVNTEIKYNNSLIGVRYLFIEENSIGMLSDKELTWNPLGNENLNGDGWSRIEENNIIQFVNAEDTIKYLISNGERSLIYFKLKSSRIELPFDITIGMRKREFVKLIDENNPSRFEVFDSFNNYDPTGEYCRLMFLFKKDTLNQIWFEAQ